MLHRVRPALPALALALLVQLLLAGAVFAQAFEPLTIVTRGGQRHLFQVEVARNNAERFKPWKGGGMKVDFERVEPVSMWMQNTYLSLDMLFVRPDGTIVRIAANTEPLSTRTIPSGEPVLAVLELNAGTAARLGIRAGDRIEHPLFKP